MKRLHELPLGSIRPQGWLERQLQLQANGLTGHLEAIWPDVGPNSGWLGGKGENWERGPYYLDGLIPLAHLLGDESLLAKAQKWLEWILASQRPDGWFGPTENHDWWPRMVVLKVLIQHAEATGDVRIEPFLQAYFNYQLAQLPSQPLESWGQARGGDNIAAVRWLQARRPNPQLDELAALLEKQTFDWDDYLHNALIQVPETRFNQLTHVVNVAMATKNYAFMRKHQPEQAQLRARGALERLDHFHGQVNGMFSGDEWLAGKLPSAGVETCAIVEFMYSLQCLWRQFGDAGFSDRLERIAFNALPAALSADLTSHQYHQQPNQVSCTIEHREWTYSSDACNTFGLEPHFGCCTANLHQGWPKFAASLWALDTAGDLVVGAYAPSRLAHGAWAVRLETDYPFNDDLRFLIDAAPATGQLKLRVPTWCTNPVMSIDEQPAAIDAVDHYFSVSVHPGQTVVLSLPRTVRTELRPRNAVGVTYGALVMCFSPGEIWQRLPEAEGETPRGRFADWEIRPRTWWNMALTLDDQKQPHVCKIEQNVSGARPFSLSEAPVRLQLGSVPDKTWRIEAGSAAPPPISPVHTEQPKHGYWFLPYGCARLRIAEFPWAPERPDSH